MSLDDLQAGVERIDEQIIQLLNERYELGKQIAALKRDQGLKTFDPEQETVLLRRLCLTNPGPMKNETLRAVYREILSGALTFGQPLRVAFFGPPTTFTHQAALTRFGSGALYMPQQGIPDVFDAVDRGQADYGVVPVENSTEGAVTHTLDMFADISVRICAEINMVVHHNLLGRCAMEELRVLYSHPQVFGQCRRWLQRNLPKVALVEVVSTTDAAERCMEEPFAGALASALAAERCDLNILARNVEDSSDNTTRFLVLANQEVGPTGDDKTSILFVVRDRVGALYDSLQPLSAHKINMTFIESRPSRRKSWEYVFFVDFLGHTSDSRVKTALEGLAEHCQFVKILGSYPRALPVT